MRRVEPPRALSRALQAKWNGGPPELSEAVARELDAFWCVLESYLDLGLLIEGKLDGPPFCGEGSGKEPCQNLFCPSSLVGEMHPCGLPLLYQPIPVWELTATCCRPFLGLEMDLQEIGELFGVSREMIRLVEAKAKPRARKRCLSRGIWRERRLVA